jgi:type III secretory pathway component EscV
MVASAFSTERKMITGEQIAGIVRAIVAALGGYLVGQGMVDAETMTAVAGAAATIAAAGWSVWSKNR